MKMAISISIHSEPYELIEAQLKNASRFADQLIVVECIHKYYSGPKGRTVPQDLIDKYNVEYHFIEGESNHLIMSKALLKYIRDDINIIHLRGCDEFYSDDSMKKIFKAFEDENIFHILYPILNFVNKDKYFAPYLRKADGGWRYDKTHRMVNGKYHERTFRNMGFEFIHSPHTVNDRLGRAVYHHPIYFGHRKILDDVYVYHTHIFKSGYKQWKNIYRYHQRKFPDDDPNFISAKVYNDLYNKKEDTLYYSGEVPLELREYIDNVEYDCYRCNPLGVKFPMQVEDSKNMKWKCFTCKKFPYQIE